MRRKNLRRTASFILAVALLAACGSATNPIQPGLTAPTEALAPALVSGAAESTATTLPTVLPSSEAGEATTTTAAPERLIQVNSPLPGALITSPVHVNGSVSISPFESTLVGRVYDAAGQVVGADPIMVDSELGQPGRFEGDISYQAGTGGPGRVEVAELSARDGSVMVSSVVEVTLAASPVAGTIEIPAAGARVVLPLRVLARVGEPGQQVTAALRWQDGTELEQVFTTVAGEDGEGLLISSLNWLNEGPPPQPSTQPATLDLRDSGGSLLARQDITVLDLDDLETQPINLFFLLGETVQPVQRRVPATAAIAQAALEELLWGPLPPNLAGFGTALPMPEDVLSFPGRQPDWGPRVTLRGVTVIDGVAMADFSKEMRAYGGGSLRVTLIRQQIEQTLRQFPGVRQVVVAVEGETEQVLQP